MSRTLLPHQVPAWEYVRNRDSIALFMKMRLGKSIVTIRWVKHRLPAGSSVLIVAPIDALSGWLDELQLEGERGTVLSGSSRQKYRALQNCQTDWVLVNYEGLRACPQIATDVAWDCVILDESTYITNPRSKVTKLVRKEFKNVPCKAVLAGEPAPESLLDYFEPFAFIHGEFLGCRTYYHFRHKYFFQPGFDWQPRSASFKKRLREEVRRLAFVLSSNEAGVKFTRIYQRRYVPLDADRLKEYRNVRKDLATSDTETKFAISVVGWLTRMAGGCVPDRRNCELWSDHKVQELRYLVEQRFANEPLVVWFRYTDEVRACHQQLSDAGVCVRAITGKTPRELRHAYIKAFNAGRIRVLLLQAKCARMGVDLRGASTAIYYSNWWDWLTRAQTEARMEHPTKIGATLLYIDLITPFTYDEDVLDTLQEKRRNSRYFLNRVMVKNAARCRSWGQDDGVRRPELENQNRESRSHQPRVRRQASVPSPGR